MKLNLSKHKLILLIFFIVIVLLYFKYYDSSTINDALNQTNQSIKVQNFHSLYWPFSFELPSDYKFKEELTYIDLYKGGKKINISRNGTNFDNVIDFVKDFDSKRTIVVESEKQQTTNNHRWIVRMEYLPNLQIKEKVYLIYLDHNIYTFSSSSTELYNDLDQIVRSFKYLPENP